MKFLTVDEMRQFVARNPELRLSDIPDEGIVMEDELLVSATCEGELIIFNLNPDAN